MAARTPATPPVIPGFSALELIGSGGYADVFLYEQEMPSRRVAVKVMSPGAVVAGSDDGAFTDEANLMARVSAHPYIVQVFQAEVSGDGRPYLVMEYYPGQDFHNRAKRERMSVSEVLRVGIQLASAIETANRAGIIHRDIKPANILTSEYNRPGLTDFGIASTRGPGGAADGVSIPWAPPEALAGKNPDQRADVYSLAATLYTLLAGRSPFEIPGGDNSELALISRVERNPVPGIGRADVPAHFERVLAGAMAKDPAHRPVSSADFARQLQGVESELTLAVTPLELAGENRAPRSRDEDINDESTRIKGVTELDAQPEQLIRDVGSAPSGAPLPSRRREGILAEPEVGETMLRPADTSATDTAADTSTTNNLYKMAAAAVIGVITIAGIAFALGGGSDSPTPTTDPVEVNDGFDSPVAVGPPAVASVSGQQNSNGTFTFNWDPPAESLQYAVTEDGAATSVKVSDTTFVADTSCIQVESISASGLISAPTRGCA